MIPKRIASEINQDDSDDNAEARHDHLDWICLEERPGFVEFGIMKPMLGNSI
jgi:hypothetical protein